MTPKHALELLRKLRSNPDQRRAYEVAEDVIMDLLNSLGHDKVGKAWASLLIRDGGKTGSDVPLPPLHLRKVQLILNMPGTGGMVVNGYVTKTLDLEGRENTFGMEIEVTGLITEQPAKSST